MSYLNVITLEQAKVYLRIDEDQTETDNEIIAMINGAFSFIEKRTNHIIFPREKTYYGEHNINVYDFPINEPLPIDNIRLKYANYSRFTLTDEITLNVGYELPLNVPEELKQAALQMLKVWYYEAEKQVNTTLIPDSVLMALDVNKRFV
jgi:hypothetical protein